MPDPLTYPRNTNAVSFFVLPMLVLAIFIAYFPGLNGPFLLDDEVNLVQNKAIALGELNARDIAHAALASESGPLKRPLASISFALNHYFAGGFHPFPFKITNLIIHLINTFLIFRLSLLLVTTPSLSLRFTRSQQLITALATSAFWGLHPLHVTSVLYVVQRMNSLSAMFVLAGLIVFLKGRNLLQANKNNGLALMSAGTGVSLLLGLTAKESAALLPLFALAIEYTLFRRDSLDDGTEKSLRIFYLCMVALPLVIFVVYITANPAYFSDSYTLRDFTPLQRLWTESRILWFYLSLILVPNTQRLGLFHDDISLSTDLLSPNSTAFAVLGWILVIIFIFYKSRKYPLLSFALSWFLVGHALESGPFGLELAFEHRNYLPSVGILFAVSCAVSSSMGKFSVHLRKLGAILTLALAFTLAFSTWSMAQTMSSINTLAENAIRNHPNSPRAIDLVTNVSLLQGDAVSALHYTLQGVRLYPNEAGFHIELQTQLAQLSSRISPELAQRPSLMNKKNTIVIHGLPECVRADKQASGWQLVCQLSSEKIILHDLKFNPISVRTYLSLKDLRECITSRIKGCESLNDSARRWFKAAITNPRTSKRIKEGILMDASVLSGFFEDYQLAYEYISLASEFSPDTLAYRLGQIEFLIRLGHADKASVQLNKIMNVEYKDEYQLANNRCTIAKLSAMLNNEQEKNN